MKKLTPFNIELLFPTDNVVNRLRPTSKTDIYDGVTSNFDDDGLFSTITFGRTGTEERDERFSYIKLNASIIHPAVFNVLKRLKSLYVDIIMGKAYAVWNPEAKDFETSDMFTGETGMAFFTRHIHHLQPDKRTSKKRNLYVDIFNKYRKDCLMTNHLVIPAGLRDLEVDKTGKETQDEINDLYRKLIANASSINLVGGKTNSSAVDPQRRSLQITANQIYDNIKSRLDGKKGFIQQKWGSRKIIAGTRNVISAVDTTAEELFSERSTTVDDSISGLFQAMNGLLPIVINRLKQRFLDEVFVSPSRPVQLIHRNTYKLVDVELDPYDFDKWATTENLEKKILGFQDDRLRNKPILINNYYLYLVYNKDDEFRVFRDINELPDPSMMEHVHPMTYSELFYLCYYEGYYTRYSLNTRYPVAGMGSIYPSRVYVKTTLNSTGKYELDSDWKTRIGYAREYPDLNQNAIWVNTLIISFTRLAGLSADYDGDMMSANYVLTDEATKEIENKLASITSVIDKDGNFLASAATNIPNAVFKAFTGRPIN